MTGTGKRVKKCVCVGGGGGGGDTVAFKHCQSVLNLFQGFFFTYIIFSPLGRLRVAYIHVGQLIN